jgi:hypothetical protein
VGFLVSDNILSSIKIFVPINDKLCYIVAKGRWFNIAFISCYAPTEDKGNETKNNFYSQLETIYDSISSKVIKVVLEDFNAKVGREQWFKSINRIESLHNISNNIGEFRLTSFMATRDMIISSTQF